MVCVGYILIDLKTGEKYIGITSRYPIRIYEHRQKGVMKGREFSYEVIARFEDMTAAREWEIREVERIGIENLLNTSLGGHGGRGRAWSQEMRDAASVRATIRQADPLFREKMSAACKKAWSDPEMRKKQSERALASIDKSVRSEAQKRAWANEKTRTKRIAGISRAANTPEGKRARRDGQLRRWGKL